MTAKVTIAGVPYEVQSWRVQEDATPLIVGDSTGGVGTISLEVPYIENLFSIYGEPIVLEDDLRGKTVGYVDTVMQDRSTGVWTVEGASRLGKLNIYNVQAQPFIGILHDAIRYYLGLAGITDGWEVEEDIRDIRVMAPGWNGELWYMLKQLLSANHIEVSLTSGVIRFRRPRGLKVVGGFETQGSPEFGLTNVAKTVEVYCYETRELKNDVIYPAYRYNNAEEVISFTAGELQKIELEIHASVSSITQPKQVTRLDEFDFSQSAFLVTTDDGRVITPTEFQQHGGFLRVDVNEDTQSLTLWVRGPEGIRERKSDAERDIEASEINTLKTQIAQSKTFLATAKSELLAAAGTKYTKVLTDSKTPAGDKAALWVSSGGTVKWYGADKLTDGTPSKTETWHELDTPAVKTAGKKVADSADALEKFEDDLASILKRQAADEVREITRFYLAGGAADAPNGYEKPQYPALRILGYGVEWRKELFTFPTGVPEHFTDNEVGITVDNPFIQNTEYVAELGPGLAARYGMADVTISGDSTSIEPTGYNGSSGKMTYSEVQALFSGKATADVFAEEAGSNQEHEARMWARAELTGYYNTVGNAAGARYYDRGSRHWFRIREATVTPDSISWSAEFDTTIADLAKVYTGLTYNDVQALNEGLTYMQVIGKGLVK